MKLLHFFTVTSYAAVVATTVAAGCRYRSFPEPLRIFSLFIFLSAVVQLASFVLSIYGINNMPMLHVYVAFGLPCIVRFYGVVLRGYISPTILQVIVAGFTVFTLVNTIFIQNIRRFNSNALAVEAVIIIILALFTFIFLLNSSVSSAGDPTGNRVGWINSGLFIYYLSCLLIFYFGDTIIFRYSRELNELTWLFHGFFLTVMYACFFTALVWPRTARS